MGGYELGSGNAPSLMPHQFKTCRVLQHPGLVQRLKLAWTARHVGLTTCLRSNTDSVPDWHPFTRVALQSVGRIPPDQLWRCKALHIYTDGSFDPVAPSAGWAFAVVAEIQAGQYAFAGSLAGPVALRGELGYLGGEHWSAPVAEDYALAWAVLWRMQLLNGRCEVPTTFLGRLSCHRHDRVGRLADPHQPYRL